MGPNCERLISDGPKDPPYNLSRRTTDARASGGFFTDISMIATDSFLAVQMEHSAWLVSASIFILISSACLLFSLLHHRCKTDYDFDSQTAIEIATPRNGGEKTIMDFVQEAAWSQVARTVPSMAIRKRTTRGTRQEVQDKASVFGGRPVGEEALPYSIARFLNQPGKEVTIGELQYFS